MTPTAQRRLSDNPVAVVGLGALFPRSGDLGEFWSNVVEARDCIEEVPESHWSVDDYYDPDPEAPDKTYCKRGGFVPTVDFDPMEFGLPPNMLEVTDVLQLLSLVVAKQTLDDAGVQGAEWYDPSRTGTVLGVTGANSLTQPLATRLQTPVLKEVVRSCGLTEQDAEAIADKFTRAFAPWEENSFPGMLGNVVAGRLANRFDFGGKNCTVDAACASSLAAVDMAVDELVSGRADLMVTGGCDAENTILMYLCFSKTPAFSRSGRIRPFDESSDGTLIGEGMGMLALKRLEDAERDGDRVYSVLRGMGSASDGRSKSIYAPRKEGQVLALRRAYQDAGFGPEKVGLVECHGTGTAVGDLTELSALREVYAAETDDTQFAAVGSVKSQIGHTKAAAGAASLIKVSLALHEKVLAPTINVEQPRRDADFGSSPFHVAARTRPWVHDPDRPVRRAAVSSFGFGGTNFHAVLEEHAETSSTRRLHPGPRVHVWHAPTAEELLDALRQDAEGLDPQEPVPAEDARLAVVAADEQELANLREQSIERLSSEPRQESFDLPGGAHYRGRALIGSERGGKVAALFAGQGSQYVGMGARAAVAVPPVRAAFDTASAATALGRVVFPPPAFDEETGKAQQEELRRTEHAQPAIGALSAGQHRFLAELGFRADGALGHSFGELTALWAAGSLDDDGFHRLARARGRAMAVSPDGGADPGTMAAVSAGPERVRELLDGHDDVVVCNLNAPDQTVVGGGTDAVGEFVSAARDAGVDVRPLPVSGAFHTRYVAHAVEPFADEVAGVAVREPAFPVYADTAGASYGRDEAANREVLVGQLTSTLSFAPRLEQLHDDGYRVFVEFGPRSLLSGMVRRTLADRDDVVVLSADAGPDRDSDRALKQLAARLVVLGAPLTRLNRYAAETARREPGKGMTIPLNGVNHVSEARREAYREALQNGYRVDQQGGAQTGNGDAPPPPANGHAQQSNGHMPAQQSNGQVPAQHPASGQQAGRHDGAQETSAAFGPGSVAAEHMAAHREFLDGQLRVAQHLSSMLQRESDQGPRDGMISGISAVAQQSVTVGESHMHASDVLRGFAEMEAGAPPSPAVPPRRMPAAYSDQPATPPAPAPAPDEQIALPAPAAPEPAPAQETPQAAAPTQQQAQDAGAPVEPAQTETGEPESGGGPTGPEEVRRTLLDIVADKTGYPANMLDPGMDVEADLGIDSIKRVEIMGGLRERFPAMPEPSPEELAELRTLDDIVGLIASAGASEGGQAQAPKA
ncbi:acyltransferase domain-containing protein [Saccharopolyspora erythraea]|uniref:type I polyketide synthase n=1 Tax=Saccharopolyspora erythraea TaxID=1836 RepID=UPI001BA875FA|nr:type I polyketide synthase [Saccharopolyspora erythraea]QUG99413.1 acyltransferase domain-containing protein [Saccharopolyspora erythraea]